MWPFSRKKNATTRIDPILRLANLESSKLGHNYIGTEHLLCALVQTSDSSVVSLFQKFGLNTNVVRDAVTRNVGIGRHPDSQGVRPQTPRLKKVLSLAEAERARLSHLTLPQSLLLAIVVESAGVAERALRSLNINLERLKEELQKPNQLPEPLSGLAPGRGSS